MSFFRIFAEQTNKGFYYGIHDAWCDIQPDGLLTNRQVFADMGSDGMTIDDQGNIYLTGDGVTVFDKSGQQIAHFPIPEDWTANVCFGGKERNILFITASKSVYTLKMLVHGVAWSH